MKKLIITLTLITTMVIGFIGMVGTAHAGDTLFGFLGDATYKVRNSLRSTIPTDVSALEADGGNFRYYEWIAPNNKNVRCWVAAGTQKGAGGCYPVGKPTK